MPRTGEGLAAELADSNLSALARRMSTQQALALPLPAPSNTVVINARCSLRIEADQRVIVIAGRPVHHQCAQDAIAEAYAMLFLVESGFAQQRGAGICPFGDDMRRPGWLHSVARRDGSAWSRARMASRPTAHLR